MGPLSDTNARDMRARIFGEGNICQRCGKLFGTVLEKQRFCSKKCNYDHNNEKMRMRMKNG